MRTHHDAKAMAKTLRDELKHHNLDLSHGQCLDIVARQFGVKDWNVLAAKIEAGNTTSDIARTLVAPNGWVIGGTSPQLFNMGCDPKAPAEDQNTLIIERARGDDPAYWNALGEFSQAFSAKDYIDRKVRLKAELRTDDVTLQAVLWLIAFDINDRWVGEKRTSLNTPNGALQGTVDWTSRSLTLKVSPEAHRIKIGFWMSGYGAAFARDFQFEIVDNNSIEDFELLPSSPQNLTLAMA